MHVTDAGGAAGQHLLVPAEVVVRLRGRVHHIPYTEGDTLLETMWRGGLPAPSACHHGVCGTCVVRCLQGSVMVRENHVLSAADLAEGLTLACQGVPTTPVCEIAIE